MQHLDIQIQVQTQFCHSWDGLTSLNEEYTTMTSHVFTLFLNSFYHGIGENSPHLMPRSRKGKAIPLPTLEAI
jgi:hypothetical protein